jgi:D-sedoheptulose 7-phosphate isomerase
MKDLIDLYLTELSDVIRNISRAEVTAVADALIEAWQARAQIFIIGNGGSAATASHMMNDLNKFTLVPGQPRFRAIALTDNVPLMTAVGNDNSYADIFVEPLKNLMEAGDTVIAISASGNSPNIIKAIEYAKANGARVIGFGGQPGGQLAKLADLRVIIPSDRIGQQEDGHMILDHVLSFALKEELKAQASITDNQ